MAGIIDIFKIASSANQANRSEEIQKANEKTVNSQPEKTSPAAAEGTDKAQISDAARELLSLKLESPKYVDDIKNSATISETEVDQLKNKVENNFYKDPEVIDKIVDKLLDLPNFLIGPSDKK